MTYRAPHRVRGTLPSVEERARQLRKDMTQVLRTYGYRVLRYANQQIDDDLDTVLESILAALKE